MPGGKHILGKGTSQRVFGTAKVGDRGQIVIPKEAREFFGIEPGDTLLIPGLLSLPSEFRRGKYEKRRRK